MRRLFGLESQQEVVTEKERTRSCGLRFVVVWTAMGAEMQVDWVVASDALVDWLGRVGEGRGANDPRRVMREEDGRLSQKPRKKL